MPVHHVKELLGPTPNIIRRTRYLDVTRTGCYASTRRFDESLSIARSLQAIDPIDPSRPCKEKSPAAANLLVN